MDKCCNHKKELVNRLARVEGHLKKVKQMVETDCYCIDIITQSLAVQAALKKVDEMVLANHMATCVKEAFEKNTVDQKMDEILTTIKYMRK